jgi:hypothetical protein
MKRQLFNVAILVVGVPFLALVVLPYWAYCGVVSKLRRRRFD